MDRSMYQVKIVDANGRTSVQTLGKREPRVDTVDVERVLQHPENIMNHGTIIRLARQGHEHVRNTLFANLDNDAYLDLVISLAGDGDAGAMEALIREADNPKCWEMIQFFAQKHDERAIDFVLRNTHREGGLLCAITLAEQACPEAKEYIRDFCALIRLADRGNPHIVEALFAHKDYSLDCRNRVLRLFAAKQQEVKHALEGCRGD